MTSTAAPPHLDQLESLSELNLAFLAFVQHRLRADLDCLGLHREARAPLRAASAELLGAAAAFPNALFRLVLPAPQPALHATPADMALHDVCSAILWSARYASRQSPYQARLLFGLQTAEIQRLRALSVTDLQRLAWLPGVLRCAFADRPWLWQWLLTAARPESRRQLALIALQPGVDRDWPPRRPPHPAA
jgi:hypothetical protein